MMKTKKWTLAALSLKEMISRNLNHKKAQTNRIVEQVVVLRALGLDMTYSLHGMATVGYVMWSGIPCSDVRIRASISRGQMRYQTLFYLGLKRETSLLRLQGGLQMPTMHQDAAVMMEERSFFSHRPSMESASSKRSILMSTLWIIVICTPEV